MKTSMKTIAVSILAAAAFVASGTAAQAGEGGAAGSVSLQFNSFVGTPPTTFAASVPNLLLIRVVRESSSIAVGKNGAISSAVSGSGIAANGSQGGNTPGETFTSAIGTGGFIGANNVVNSNSNIFVNPETANVPNSTLGLAQANTLTPGAATITRTILSIP